MLLIDIDASKFIIWLHKINVNFCKPCDIATKVKNILSKICSFESVLSKVTQLNYGGKHFYLSTIVQ